MERFPIEKTAGPIGYSSILRRHHAMVAKHKTYSMREFIRTLADNHDDLNIANIDYCVAIPEDKISKSESSESDLSECEIPDVQLDIPDIICPKCRKVADNTNDLVKHYLNHDVSIHSSLYERLNVIPSDINDTLKQIMEDVMKNSVVKKKISNENFTLNCSLESPIAPFLVMRYLKVYLSEPEVKKSFNHKLVKIQLKRSGTELDLFFDFTYIERAVSRIKTARSLKVKKRIASFHEKKCQKAFVNDHDLYYKEHRTEEVTECLAKALNLPLNFTQEQLRAAIEAITDYKPDMPDVNLNYKSVVDEDGNCMTKEQRKLISTLSNNFTYVSGTKRRCTRNKIYT